MHEFISNLDIFPPEQLELMLDELNNESITAGRNYGIIGLDGFHLIRLYYGSAKTGAGVKDAFEWLITTAKSQVKHDRTENS